MEVSERWKKRLVAAGLLLPFLAVLFSLAPVPDAAVDGDLALLELGVRQTARGQNFLGPYSRFHFNHPGPSYHVVMLPLYWLLDASHGSMMWTAVFLNLAAVLLIYAVIRGQPWTVVASAGLLISLYLYWLGPERLFSVWNPDISNLAFGASLFCFAAGASGRPAYLFPAFGLASFATQSHLAYAAPAFLVTSATILAIGFPALVGRHQKSSPKRWQVAALLAFLILLWLPPLIEELRADAGNVSKILSFFSLPHSGKNLADALTIAGERLWGGAPIVPIPGRVWLSALLTIGLSAAFFAARKRGDALASSLGLLCLAGLAGATLAVSRIVGPLHDHLVSWISVLGLASLVALLLAFAPAANGMNIKTRQAASLFLAGSFALVSVLNIGASWAPNRLRDWPQMPKHEQIEEIADLTKKRLQQESVRLPEVRIATVDSWPEAAGVLLRLDKLQTGFCVEEDWLFLFGEGSSCRQGSDGFLIFGDAGFLRAVAEDDRFELLAEWDDGAVFLASDPPPPETIDFSGPESALYLNSGFAALARVETDGGRWSVGASSVVRLPLEAGQGFSLAITAYPLSIPGRTQTVRLSLNGSPLTEFPMVDRELTYFVGLPAANVLASNQLRFDYAYAEPPMLHQAESEDWRRLGVFFRRIRVAITR